MNRSYNFAVVQFAAHAMRDERLNIGLAVFSDDKLEIRLPKKLDKLNSISPAIDLETLRTSLEGLEDLDKFIRGQGCKGFDDRVSLLTELSAIRFSGKGEFAAHNSSSYEDEVFRLFQTLVEPEPAAQRERKKRSKLLTFLKSALRNERVLARKGEDISDHRVVPNVKIAEGLQADLVLKNGAMHIIETIDASADEISAKKVVSDIAVAALVLEQARMIFGVENTSSRLVYDAASSLEKIAMPSLLTVAHQGAELYNWASDQDRTRLLNSISALAIPYEEKGRQKSPLKVHASTQHSLKLN